MDLETIIPLVLVAVAYIYKAFEESAKKKKGEEAAERRPKSPAPSPVLTQRKQAAEVRKQVAETRKQGSEIGKQVVETRKQIVESRKQGSETRKQVAETRKEASGIPNYNTELPKTVSEPDWWEASPADEGNWWGGEPTFKPEPLPVSRRESYQPEAKHSKPAPVRENLRRGTAHSKPPSALTLDEPETLSENESDYSDFDLEDAVIKSVILERREF